LFYVATELAIRIQLTPPKCLYVFYVESSDYIRDFSLHFPIPHYLIGVFTARYESSL